MRRISLGEVSRTFPKVYRMLGPARWWIWVLGVLSLVSGVVDAASLYLVARLATALTDSTSEVHVQFGSLIDFEMSVSATLAWAGALIAVLLLLSVPLATISARLSATALINCRVRLIDAYLGSSWKHRSGHSEGHLQHVVVEFTPRMERLVLYLATIVVSSAGILMAIAAAVMGSPGTSIYFLIGLGIVAGAFVPVSRALPRLSAAYVVSNQDLSTSVAQTARLGQEIEVFDVARPIADNIEREVAAGAVVLRRFRFRMAWVPAAYQNAALAVVVGVVAVLRATNSGGLNAMGPILLLLVRALIYARQLQNAMQSAAEMTPYAARLEEEIETLLAHRAVDAVGTIDTLETLRFDHVGFAYSPNPPVFENVSFSIAPGEVVGIAGPSGVGKSTLLQLLLRLRQPTSGEITVNGTDLDLISAASWSSIVGFVPQDNKLVRGTVRDNIAFYRDCSPAAVEEAARQAHLEAEIRALPHGFDTEIGPGARDLSGGQKQRLGIARALVGRPQLLVLDEPTSALDPGSESLISDALRQLKGWTTVVVVAHRAETLAACDRVLELARDASGDVTLLETSPASLTTT